MGIAPGLSRGDRGNVNSDSIPSAYRPVSEEETKNTITKRDNRTGATAVAKHPVGHWKTRGPPNHKFCIGGVEWDRHPRASITHQGEDAQGGPMYPVPSGQIISRPSRPSGGWLKKPSDGPLSGVVDRTLRKDPGNPGPPQPHAGRSGMGIAPGPFREELAG